MYRHLIQFFVSIMYIKVSHRYIELLFVRKLFLVLLSDIMFIQQIQASILLEHQDYLFELDMINYSDTINNPLISKASSSSVLFEGGRKDFSVKFLHQLNKFVEDSSQFSQGVSASFVGCIDDVLLLAGGANFPDIPAEKGGSKMYYKDVYAASIAGDTLLSWQKVGELPQPIAYGFSVSIPGGVVCVGGMNEDGPVSTVFRLSVENGELGVENLPSLPFTLENMSGCLVHNKLYVVGGNRNGKASNTFCCLNLEKPSEGWVELSPFPGMPRTQPVCAAQKSETGEMAIYLWGGFSAASPDMEASLSTDGYKYLLESDEWVPLSSPTNARGEMVSLGGGVAAAVGDSLIVCMGGVNKDIFLQALRNPAPDYLSHPVEWYKFNKDLLVYNVFSREWQTIYTSSNLARAGAVVVPYKNSFFYINGEVKPGVRTPTIVRIDF